MTWDRIETHVYCETGTDETNGTRVRVGSDASSETDGVVTNNVGQRCDRLTWDRIATNVYYDCETERFDSMTYDAGVTDMEGRDWIEPDDIFYNCEIETTNETNEVWVGLEASSGTDDVVTNNVGQICDRMTQDRSETNVYYERKAETTNGTRVRGVIRRRAANQTAL